MMRTVKCNNEEYALLCDSAICKLEQLENMIMAYFSDMTLPVPYALSAMDALIAKLKYKKAMFDKMGLETWSDSKISSLESFIDTYKKLN